MEHTLQQIAEVAGLISGRGWAERNAGNISIDVTDKGDLLELPSAGRDVTIEVDNPELAGRCYLVTATGARFRDIAKQPDHHVVLVRISDDLAGYRIFGGAGETTAALTTSEFPSHLGIHSHLLRTDPTKKAVLHTHPDHLVALTHVPRYLSTESLNRLLWSMHPEMKVVMPEGVGIVPYRPPGSEELARATVETLHNHRMVLWEKHGCIAVGRDLFEAYDLIDTAEKSARIFFLVRSADFEPEGLSQAQLEGLDLLVQSLSSPRE